MLFLLDGIISAAVSVLICMGGAFADGTWVWVLPVSFLVSYLTVAFLMFVVLWAACEKIDMTKPQEHDSPFYRKLIKPYLQAVCVLLRVKLEVKGLENVPQNGRFLLIANHLSEMDPVLLLHCFPDSQLAFISKRENRTMFIVGKFMHAIMCQMINRENDREALKTILKCIQLLKDDEVSIAVFPEGYTSPDGLLQKFRPGVFKIAQKAQVPIVICAFQGTDKVFRNALRLQPTEVKLHLVAVIPPEELKGITAVEVSDRCHRLMAGDLGPALIAAQTE